MSSVTIALSLVIYRQNIDDIAPLLDSLNNLVAHPLFTSGGWNCKLLVYDNGGSSRIQNKILLRISSDIEYRHTKSTDNIGFGAGHNRNYKLLATAPDLFVITNPDIEFSSSIIAFFQECLSNHRIALAAPLIVDQRGTIQLSCKKNPTILSLMLGRFSCLQQFSYLRSYMRENRNEDKLYTSQSIQSDYLSGCFLCARPSYYELVDGFDERYFLHMEDADLCRSIAQEEGLVLHLPIAEVCHRWARGSHKSISQTLHLSKSALKYFLKWGFQWF